MARRSKGGRGSKRSRAGARGSKGGAKQPLRTSREVHDQIRWDATLDERAFTVAYEERFAGLQEVPFLEFPTDGTIPWHRVWRYRVGELVVWSRRDRVDMLHGSGGGQLADVEAVRAACARVRSAPAQRDPAAQKRRARRPRANDDADERPVARPAYRFDADAKRWIEAVPPADAASAPRG